MNAKKRSKNTLTKPTHIIKPTKKLTTHLYLNDRFLTSLQSIELPKTLSILYLHNNSISKIDHLSLAVNLKSLYLQKNKISKLENLQCLKNLKKLYLGHNEISVVEGLENLTNLEELHIEKQRLINNESLCFDPRTIKALSETLKVINLSYNNMISFHQLKPLKSITYINASFNKLDDIYSVCNTLSNWYYLNEANFQGNPIVKLLHYRENVISCTFQLFLLDNKEINEMTRCFIKRLEREKLNQTSKHALNLLPLPSIAKNYPTSMQKAISQSILQNTKPYFNKKIIQRDDGIEEIFVPWKTMAKSTGNLKKRFPDTVKRSQLKKNPAILGNVPF